MLIAKRYCGTLDRLQPGLLRQTTKPSTELSTGMELVHRTINRTETGYGTKVGTLRTTLLTVPSSSPVTSISLDASVTNYLAGKRFATDADVKQDVTSRLQTS